MLELTSLEVYNFVFNLTEKNNDFEFYTDYFDEFSFTELKDELYEISDFSIITSDHLQGKKVGPRMISAYNKLEAEKRRTDGYIILLMGYDRSPFGGFECYLRIVVGSDEDHIQLFLKRYNSNSFTYESSPGIYSIKDISEVVYPRGWVIMDKP